MADYEGSSLSIPAAADFLKAMQPKDMQSLAKSDDAAEQLPARMMLEHVGDKDTSWKNAVQSLKDGANYKKELLDLANDTCASTRAAIERLDGMGRLEPEALRERNAAAFAMAVFMEAVITDTKKKLGLTLITGGAETTEDPEDTDGGAAPEWPITIPFSKIQQALDTAIKHKRTPLFCCHGKASVVDTFFQYSGGKVLIDAKYFLNKVVVKKGSIDDAREEIRKKLVNAIKNGVFIQVGMMNSAVAFKEQYCQPDCFPADFFKNELWIQEETYSKVVREEDLKDWTGAFPGKMRDGSIPGTQPSYVFITSDFSEEMAKEHLSKALPHFDDMALINIDPASIDS